MEWIYFLLAVAFVVGIVVASLLWKRDVKIEQTVVRPQRYGKSESLMSEQERAIFPLIQWAIGKELQVFPKVSLGAIITVPQNVDRRFVHLRQVNSHMVDFALCVVGRAMPVVIIQVADPEDEDTTRHESDQFIKESLKMARIPVLWLKPGKNYLAHEIKQQIQHAVAHPHDLDDNEDSSSL